MTKEEIKERLLEAVKGGSHFADIKSVALFGSYVNGSPSEDSDVDVLIDFEPGIEEYLEVVSYEEFTSNKMIIDAVVRELEIIGEASNNLSEEFRERHPDIVWRRMKDMRNFLNHEYFGVNIKVVWDTCKEDLPKLSKLINDLLC